MNRVIKLMLILLVIGVISLVYINMDNQTTDYVKVIENILDESIEGIAVSISDVNSLHEKKLLLDIETTMVNDQLKSWNNNEYLAGLSIEILKELVTLEDGYTNMMLSSKEFYLIDINMDFTKGNNVNKPHSITLYIDKETHAVIVPQVYDVENKYNMSINNQHTFKESKELNDLVDSLLEGLIIEAKEPSYTLDQNYGVTMVSLEYASDEITIFRGAFGLFVYSLTEEKLLRSVDLADINCEAQQGSEAAWLSVSSDGQMIYIYKANSDGMYIYDVELNVFTASIYKAQEDSVELHDSFEELSFANGLISATCIKFGDDDYGYLETEDYTIGTLKYVRGDKVYDIFK